MLSVLGGHTDCVHFLLEKSALPDAKDKRGHTALHRGVNFKHPIIEPQYKQKNHLIDNKD